VVRARFHKALANRPDALFLISPSGQWSYSDFSSWCNSVAARLQGAPGQRLACYLVDSPQLIAVMLGAAISGKSLLVLSRAEAPEQLPSRLAALEIDCLISDLESPPDLPCHHLPAGDLGRNESPDPVDADSDGELHILTSGTTGSPKCARYLWSDLLAQIRTRQEDEEVRWLLAYRLNHFAGVQMLAHVLGNCGTLVLAGSDRVGDALAAMEDYAVTHMSSTPTFWRFALALLQDSHRSMSLKHITLGSEAVSPGLLEQLKARFPGARIVHIYASTEAGSLISVDDMQAGLPVGILARPADAEVQFRIHEDELYVKSKHGMQAYLNADDSANLVEDGWRATGDLVRIEGQRIHFMGRRSETINVGGVKVHPLEVEAIITALPGVTLARVYGQDNPVVGQIVAVDLVVQEHLDPAAVENGVRKACMALPRHSRPGRINLVDSLDTSNHKLVRR